MKYTSKQTQMRKKTIMMKENNKSLLKQFITATIYWTLKKKKII
jgi:hypothetical protein